MGRWEYDSLGPDDNGYGNIYIGDSRAHRYDDYVRIHNADCDAYEARIAELEQHIAKGLDRRGNDAHDGGPTVLSLVSLLEYVRDEHLRDDSSSEMVVAQATAIRDAYEARIAELERRCKTMMIQVAGRDEDEIGRVFSVDSVKCPYCKETTPLEEEGGHAEEVIGNFDRPYGNEECRHCGKNFYYEFEYFVLADAMTMEYDGTPIAEGRDNG